MSAFAEKSCRSEDGLSLYYRDYGGGAPGRPPVLCLHGLTRNSADFHDLAMRLTPRYRVLSVDVRGRGKSDYDPNYTNYHPGTYVSDVACVLDAESLDAAVFVGTSMGGLMTMIAATVMPERIRGAVINDIGPEIEAEGLARIGGYVGKVDPVDDWEAAARAAEAINAQAFPAYGPEDWMAFARRTFVEGPEGRPKPAYDPGIARALAEAGPAKADLWPAFEALARRPVLLVRGATSDLLSAETARAMKARASDLDLVEVPGVGHAPFLVEPEALGAIEAFLDRLPAAAAAEASSGASRDTA